MGLGVSPHPGLNPLAEKQELASDAADGYRAFLYKIVDSAFLDPQRGRDSLVIRASVTAYLSDTRIAGKS